MGFSLRLLIPLGLAILAATVNYMAMSALTRPITFVQVTQDLKYGEHFSEANLTPLEVPAAFENLGNSAVPWREHGILDGQPAMRNFTRGDIVFWRDSPRAGLSVEVKPEEEDVLPLSLQQVEVVAPLLRVGSRVLFRFSKDDPKGGPVWVGPFTIVSVGNRLTNEKDPDGRSQEHQRRREEAHQPQARAQGQAARTVPRPDEPGPVQALADRPRR